MVVARRVSGQVSMGRYMGKEVGEEGEAVGNKGGSKPEGEEMGCKVSEQGGGSGEYEQKEEEAIETVGVVSPQGVASTWPGVTSQCTALLNQYFYSQHPQVQNLIRTECSLNRDKCRV